MLSFMGKSRIWDYFGASFPEHKPVFFLTTQVRNQKPAPEDQGEESLSSRLLWLQTPQVLR